MKKLKNLQFGSNRNLEIIQDNQKVEMIDHAFKEHKAQTG